MLLLGMVVLLSAAADATVCTTVVAGGAGAAGFAEPEDAEAEDVEDESDESDPEAESCGESALPSLLSEPASLSELSMLPSPCSASPDCSAPELMLSVDCSPGCSEPDTARRLTAVVAARALRCRGGRA